MPFPLAHPAAVLPLRRYCPRFLCFRALVVGSMTPDLGYFFSGAGIEELSHRLAGSIAFCLPAGLLALALFYGLSSIAERYLPVFHQRVLVPFSRPPGRTPAVGVILSLLVGSWTHLALDSVTHSNGWAVAHLPVLQTTIATVHSHRVRLCHVLWYACSFAGMAWLFMAFRNWQEIHASGTISQPWQKRALEAGLVASLLLPIEVVHHLIHGRLGLVLVAVLSLAWGVGVALRLSGGPRVGQRAVSIPDEST